MYAVANFEKFIQDNQLIISVDEGREIMARAVNCSCDGLVSGGSVDAIMDNPGLAEQFRITVESSVEHLRIGLKAMGAPTPNPEEA